MAKFAFKNVESANVESARGEVDDLSARVFRGVAGRDVAGRDVAWPIDDMPYAGAGYWCRPRRRSNGAALNTTSPPPSLAKPSRVSCDLTAALREDASAF